MEVQRRLVLPGTAEPRTSAIVASEVAGLVIELKAREGDYLKKGAYIAQLRRRNIELLLAAEEASLAESKARLELAERSLDRSQELFDSGVISRQQLDDAVSESDAWHGRVDQDEADIDRLQDGLKQSTIRAPFSGVVVREHVEAGEWLPVGGPVVEMLNLDELEVVVEVPAHHYRNVARGAPVTLRFDALPGLEVEGQVAAIIPRADARARTFPVKVLVPNHDNRIGAGMLAEASLAAGEALVSIVVPKDAVVRQGGGTVVWVIDEEGAVNPSPVQTGGATGIWIAVTGAVQPGQKVVTRGNERLRPGQKVTPKLVEYEVP